RVVRGKAERLEEMNLRQRQQLPAAAECLRVQERDQIPVVELVVVGDQAENDQRGEMKHQQRFDPAGCGATGRRGFIRSRRWRSAHYSRTSSASRSASPRS